MIPIDGLQIEEFTVEEETSKTYKLDYEKDRIQGYTDELEAVKQAIYKILNTEKYRYPIYSWDYGVELSDLIGRERSYVIPEIERRITEALFNDDRVVKVSDFHFDFSKSKYHVTFSVLTSFGEMEVESEVVV